MFRIRFLLTLVFFIALTSVSMQSSNIIAVQLAAGDVSSKDVQAPKSITFIDDEATELAKQNAVNQVQKVYDQDKSISQNLSTSVSTFITSIINAKSTIESKIELEKANLAFNQTAFIDNTLNAVHDDLGFTLAEKKTLINLSKVDLEKLSSLFTREIERTFTQGITGDSLDLTKQQFQDRSAFYYFSDAVRLSVMNHVLPKIQPNLLYNKEETEKRINQALDSTQPVYKVIKKGEMILRKGEVISNDQMLKLEKLGLVKTDFDYRMFVKDFPLIMLFFLLFHMFCYRFYNTMFSQYRIYLFILLLFAFVLSFESFIDDTRFLLIPFITALMIIVSLWGRRFMIFSSLILGLLLSTKVGNDYSFLISLIVSAFVLSFSFNSKGTRNALFVSSLITGTSVAASMWIISYSSELVLDYVYLFKTSLYSVLFCFGAAILSVGSLYLIERLLGLVSHARLYELTDQNHPLLRELQKNAPGTYTHSIMVANLAEMAADEIGANGVLVRAAAFFHDVGKLKNPKFFIENSSPEDNAHNNLEPLESAKIILDHPHESVRLCREHKLPDVVNEVIASHHGDSLVRVFYNKAQEMGLNPVEKDYRYTTPSPSSKEQGILMLADSVEAFSRTLYGKSKDDVYLSLRDMIFEKIKRGELRHCELDFSEVEIIIEVFSSYLSTVPHLRLSYPKG